jgi:hypothetical protein
MQLAFIETIQCSLAVSRTNNTQPRETASDFERIAREP